jgi:hypothetical protein
MRERSGGWSMMNYFDKHKNPATYFWFVPTPPTAPTLANLGAVDKQYATRTQH